VCLAAPVDPDHTDADVVIGAEHARVGPGEGKTEAGSIFEDLAAVRRFWLIRGFLRHGETLRKRAPLGNAEEIPQLRSATPPDHHPPKVSGAPYRVHWI